jgi:subtilisin family serine protease
MNNSYRTLFTVLSILTLGLFHGTALAGVPDDGPIPGRYIVTLKQGVEPAGTAKALAVAHALTIGHVYRHALRGFAARIPDARLQQLRDDPRVETVVADHYMHISAKPVRSQPAQETPTGIGRINGPGGAASGVKVAVIDTGINKHPDLPTIAGGKNCSTGRSYADGNGHGTHVAGTIGALDNDIGVVGVAPGVPLLAVRVLDNSGSGSWASVICGIDWVTAEANKDPSTRFVANMSLGGSGPLGACTDGGLHQAVCNSVNSGVTYAVAAGNSFIDASTPNSSGYVQVPAAYPEVITVSALADFNGQPGGGASPTCRTDVDDTFANFSNYGDSIDLIAPGVCIKSTWKDGGYNTISGTSMATPHVTGAAALYLWANSGATPAEVQTGLTSLGNDGWDDGDDPDPVKEPLLDVSP